MSRFHFQSGTNLVNRPYGEIQVRDRNERFLKSSASACVVLLLPLAAARHSLHPSSSLSGAHAVRQTESSARERGGQAGCFSGGAGQSGLGERWRGGQRRRLWIWREPSSTLPVWPVGRLFQSHGSHVPGGETLKKRNARQRRDENRLSFIFSLPVVSRKVMIPHQKDTARPKCPRRAILVPPTPFFQPTDGM